jgi:hypothetical protein
MQKAFEESLKDGFRHIVNITDPKLLNKLRGESILVDDEGYYTFEFGDNKEYSLNVEPIGNGYYISLYKNKIRITEPLPVKPL